MKFYSIDACDQFSDVTIFWVTLTNLPDEIRNRAMLIDGENFSETCFGVWVSFDEETKKFEIVWEMDRNEVCTVYYIDNDGEKHWFACEIPEKVTKRIFSECQKILDFQKMEGGYEIKECVQFEDNSGFVLAKKPNSERPYLTASFSTNEYGQRCYVATKSFHHRSDAIEDFTKRTEHRKQFLRVKPDQTQASKHHHRDAKQVKKQLSTRGAQTKSSVRDALQNAAKAAERPAPERSNTPPQRKADKGAR